MKKFLREFKTNKQYQRRALAALVIIILVVLLIIYLLNQQKNLGYGDATEQDTTISEISEDQITQISYDGRSSFTLKYEKISNDNVLTVNDKKEIKGVVSAKWSTDSSTVIFTKTELKKEEQDGSGQYMENNSNLWAVDADGSNVRQIKDFDTIAIDFVSNGKTIAFAMNDKIGLINIDGSDMRTIHSFEPPASNADVVYLPQLEFLDPQTFVAIIRDKDFWTNGKYNEVQLKFDQR